MPFSLVLLLLLLQDQHDEKLLEFLIAVVDTELLETKQKDNIYQKPAFLSEWSQTVTRCSGQPSTEFQVALKSAWFPTKCG